ncbi:MAG: DUF998 domain-containing protein [Candidatus Dormibacteraceae bacterium]
MAVHARSNRPRVQRWAGVLWLAIVQWFVVQGIVQLAWPHPYSAVRNAISDLGRLSCGPQLCSPWHDLMNASFVALGLCMAAGAVAAEASSPRVSRLSRAGAAVLALAGLGVILVGLVPEDTIAWLHMLGAGLAIVGGNAGTLLTGILLWRAGRLRWVGMLGCAAGVLGALFVGLLAVSLLSGALFDVQGLLERGAVYPLLLAMIVSGGALVRGDWLQR